MANGHLLWILIDDAVKNWVIHDDSTWGPHVNLVN